MSEDSPHVLSYRQLLAVLGGLLLLTGITIFAARFDLGVFTVWLALLIASVKASLVLLFFMHLKFEGKVFAITFVVTVFTVAALIGLLFFDLSWRTGAGG